MGSGIGPNITGMIVTPCVSSVYFEGHRHGYTLLGGGWRERERERERELGAFQNGGV